ncbi:ABC transporter ATP-binding protein/permease [Almyronema epifaneia]|uniref:ABC transporter ATP-binding protein/permease n=1 Tax=Almyronema epifaneia S1 TaxID=2991925 RepID=A0ABW6IGL8_9CYAN
MDRVDFSVFGRFWAIAKAYWFSDEKWKARGLLLLVVVCLLAYTGLSVLLNNKRGVLISALSAQNESRFWQTVIIFIVVLVLYAPLLAGYVYLRDRLGLQWRRWLTNHFVDQYFANRAFYQLNQSNAEIDNPDQRIAEDVRSFTQESLTFLLVVVDSLLEVIAFSGVLWGISRSLVVFLILYAVVGTLVAAFVFGKPLVRLNFEQLKREANFRFSLVRIRENAEAIAFYRGEDQESQQVKTRFMAAFDNFKNLLFWELNLNALTNAYEFIPYVLPAIVVAPSVFAGDLEVGKVTEAQGAFVRVFFSLNVIVARFQELTAFGAGIDRLATFADFLNGVTQPETAEQPIIKTQPAADLALIDLTLQTPNYQRTLVENLSLQVPSQQGLLIVGPSGCGKSSLLRAIAGLWNSGSGAIARPDLDHMLFLPQKPYMILGTLRAQMCYPNVQADIDDEKLQHILQQVNLPDLAERFGGLAAEQDWGDVLSLGEQQRLTFARLLVNQPDYAILDEATSALDRDNEASLYQQLKQLKTTFISVGHRRILATYHQHVLQLDADHHWQLRSPQDLLEAATEATPAP